MQDTDNVPTLVSKETRKVELQVELRKKVYMDGSLIEISDVTIADLRRAAEACGYGLYPKGAPELDVGLLLGDRDRWRARAEELERQLAEAEEEAGKLDDSVAYWKRMYVERCDYAGKLQAELEEAKRHTKDCDAKVAYWVEMYSARTDAIDSLQRELATLRGWYAETTKVNASAVSSDPVWARLTDEARAVLEAK